MQEHVFGHTELADPHVGYEKSKSGKSETFGDIVF